MAHSLHPVRRLPPELIRRIADQLIGIKEWATIFKGPETPSGETSGNAEPASPARRVNFVGLRTLPYPARLHPELRESSASGRGPGRSIGSVEPQRTLRILKVRLSA